MIEGNAESKVKVNIGGVEFDASFYSEFDSLNGFPACVVHGVNTESGDTVAIDKGAGWQFVNPCAKKV